MDQFILNTGFADHRMARGMAPLRNVHIKGTGGFLAALRDTPENRDRAKLLIAAPDLLAALKLIAAPIEGTPVGDPWAFYADLQAVARKAIAKAEGK